MFKRENQEDWADKRITLLEAALKKCLKEVDGWYDECRGDGVAPNLENERALLTSGDVRNERERQRSD